MSEPITNDRLSTSGAAPATSGAPNSLEQMKSLAAQFESVLLGQMMKQMRESLFSENEEEGKASGFAGGPLADQVYSELSLALSRAGGVGLGAALGPALARQASALGNASGGIGGASGVLPLGIPMPPGLDQDTPAADAISASGLLGATFRQGTAVALPPGSDVQAAQSGKVEWVGDVPGSGLTVVVSHPGGLATQYPHLSEALVKAGDTVTRGQVLARSGPAKE